MTAGATGNLPSMSEVHRSRSGHSMSASLIGRSGSTLSGYPPLQCRCRSRARASLRTRHQGPLIVVRGALPHRCSIRAADRSCLAVRSLFLLSLSQDGRRLVCAVRLGHGLGRSGCHLQARQLLPARARDCAQRRPSVSREIELGLEPPRSYVVLSYLGYLTGIVGTGIWGYGDLLIRSGA